MITIENTEQMKNILIFIEKNEILLFFLRNLFLKNVTIVTYVCLSIQFSSIKRVCGNRIEVKLIYT